MPVITFSAFPVMPEFTITPPGVEKLLRELKVNKAEGPDGIPSRLLKILAPQITPGLSFIFDSSLHSGILPQDWKSAIVTPIHKKEIVLKQRITDQCRSPASLVSV